MCAYTNVCFSLCFGAGVLLLFSVSGLAVGWLFLVVAVVACSLLLGPAVEKYWWIQEGVPVFLYSGPLTEFYVAKTSGSRGRPKTCLHESVAPQRVAKGVVWRRPQAGEGTLLDVDVDVQHECAVLVTEVVDSPFLCLSPGVGGGKGMCLYFLYGGSGSRTHTHTHTHTHTQILFPQAPRYVSPGDTALVRDVELKGEVPTMEQCWQEGGMLMIWHMAHLGECRDARNVESLQVEAAPAVEEHQALGHHFAFQAALSSGDPSQEESSSGDTKRSGGEETCLHHPYVEGESSGLQLPLGQGAPSSMEEGSPQQQQQQQEQQDGGPFHHPFEELAPGSQHQHLHYQR
mgnify:FL=1